MISRSVRFISTLDIFSAVFFYKFVRKYSVCGIFMNSPLLKLIVLCILELFYHVMKPPWSEMVRNSPKSPWAETSDIHHDNIDSFAVKTVLKRILTYHFFLRLKP